MDHQPLHPIPAIILALVVLGTVGYLGYSQLTTNDQQLITNNVEEPRDESLEASTEIDTSDWKVYRNEEYGFEVMLPMEWKLNEKEPMPPGDSIPKRGISYIGIVDSEESENVIGIRAYPHGSPKDIREWILENIGIGISAFGSIDIDLFNYAEVQQFKGHNYSGMFKEVDEHSVYWMPVEFAQSALFAIVSGDYVYRIDYISWGDEELESILTAILSTFKFTK